MYPWLGLFKPSSVLNCSPLGARNAEVGNDIATYWVPAGYLPMIPPFESHNSSGSAQSGQILRLSTITVAESAPIFSFGPRCAAAHNVDTWIVVGFLS